MNYFITLFVLVICIFQFECLGCEFYKEDSSQSKSHKAASFDKYILDEEFPKLIWLSSNFCIIRQEVEFNITDLESCYSADFINLLLYDSFKNSEFVKVYPAIRLDQLKDLVLDTSKQEIRYAYYPLNINYGNKCFDRLNHWTVFIFDTFYGEVFFLDPAIDTFVPDEIINFIDQLKYPKKDIFYNTIDFQQSEKEKKELIHCGDYIIEISEQFPYEEEKVDAKILLSKLSSIIDNEESIEQIRKRQLQRARRKLQEFKGDFSQQKQKLIKKKYWEEEITSSKRSSTNSVESLKKKFEPRIDKEQKNQETQIPRRKFNAKSSFAHKKEIDKKFVVAQDTKEVGVSMVSVKSRKEHYEALIKEQQQSKEEQFLRKNLSRVSTKSSFVNKEEMGNNSVVKKNKKKREEEKDKSKHLFNSQSPDFNTSADEDNKFQSKKENKRVDTRKKRRISLKLFFSKEDDIETQTTKKTKFLDPNYTHGVDSTEYKKCLIEDRKGGCNQGGVASQLFLFQQSCMNCHFEEDSNPSVNGPLFQNMLQLQKSAEKNLLDAGLTISQILVIKSLNIHLSEISTEQNKNYSVAKATQDFPSLILSSFLP